MKLRVPEKLEGPEWDEYLKNYQRATGLSNGDYMKRFELLFPEAYTPDTKPFHPGVKPVQQAYDKPTKPTKPQLTLLTERKEEEQMPIIAVGVTEKRKPAPAGLHAAVCVDVEDRGMQPNKYHNPDDPKSKAETHKIRIIWEIEEIDPDYGTPYTVANSYTLSLKSNAAGVPSKLRSTLEAWRGKAFTEEELKGFDVEKLIGAPCVINVTHKDGYANIESVSAWNKRFPKLTPSPGYVRVKDRAPKTTEPEPSTDGQADGDDVAVPF